MSLYKNKRKAFRTCTTEDQALTGSSSPLPMLQPHNFNLNDCKNINNNNNNQALLNLIHYANVMQIFKKSIQRFKGTNIPVTYKDSYDFSQKWQQSNKIKYERNQIVYLAANGICLALAIIVMLHKIPLIWYFSVYRIFGLQISNIWWGVSLGIIVVDLLLKIFLVRLEMSKFTQKNECQSSKIQFNISVLSMFLLDFITILVILIQLVFNIQSQFQIVIDFAVMVIQINRFNQIYNSLTIILISNKYKNYVDLFGFISKLFTAVHMCAIIVYAAAIIEPDHNWLNSIGKQNADAITCYIYSIYFTGTTMFTVGYGDILPVNKLQIIVILLIQAFGIVMIGYIVNEIGHTLSVMRQVREDFEHDIQNADTICHHYNLNEELKNRVRNYIVNHRLANEELNTNEQNNILMKLNEELRNQVKYVNHLNIIKTSLFFICHWSKKMQNDLSKKLQKYIFSPNQPITKQDKLYIVTKGKVDVYTERKMGAKVFCKKHLKTIFKDPNKQVYSNVYGYTSLFTGKPNRLTAISKDFAICYALQYSDILQTLKDDQRDFQSYHQLKTRLETEQFPEIHQIPNLINNRQHYCPTKSFVLKNYGKQLMKKQDRSYKQRLIRKAKFVCLIQKEEQGDSESEVYQSGEQLEEEKVKNSDIKERSYNISLNELAEKNTEAASKSFISFRSYRRRYYSRIVDQKAKNQQVKRLLEEQVINTSLFEVGKNFNKYFKKNNCSYILSQLTKNAINDFDQINSKYMSLDWIDLLVFGSKVQKQKSRLVTKKLTVHI